MNNLQLVYVSFFLFLINVSSSSSAFNRTHKCHEEQKDALLVFMENISTLDYQPYDRWFDYISPPCKDLLDPKGKNWKRSIDCCEWDGITCNNFTGDVISLDLSCGMLQGVSKLDDLLSALPKLEALDLSYNKLSVVTRNGVPYAKPNLYELRLAFCNLTLFPYFLRGMNNLQILDLSGNNISGQIPAWAGEIGGNNLTYLDLSENYIKDLPEFKSDRLEYLDLLSNQIHGSFPAWICRQKHLTFLDIRENNISGVVPQCLQNISSSLVYLHVSSNMIHGQFPPLICNMSSLLYLDMSLNNFHGVLPQCFGNITSSLKMIDLAHNQFHGTIPRVYKECGLKGALDLGGNKFEGEVPSSLAKCDSLRVLFLDDNQFNGTFPIWVAHLQKLEFLSLRSNNFHGSIQTPAISEFLFPRLRIFDLADNEFVGRLPEKYLESFDVIKDVDNQPEPIWLKIIDLSSNRFEGEIPDVIGNLRSLLQLNLSNNKLDGQIPRALGNIINMKSLDLSRNQLVGEIPQSFVHLKSLAHLNLSQNHLVGRIPKIETFNSSSYLGNPGLCGPPLTRQCEDLIISPPAEGGRWIYIDSVMSGLAFGTLLGMVLGYYMLSTGRPKWVSAIADAGSRMSNRTQKKKRKVHTRKRN